MERDKAREEDEKEGERGRKKWRKLEGESQF